MEGPPMFPRKLNTAVCFELTKNDRNRIVFPKLCCVCLFVLLLSVRVVGQPPFTSDPAIVPSNTDSVISAPIAEDGLRATEADFDWTQYRTSAADLAVGLPLPFQQRKPNLTEAEAEAYVELLNMIQERRFAVQLDAGGEDRTLNEQENVWESAFYKFEEARRLAWRNGKLQLNSGESGMASPFGGGSREGGNLTRAAISSSAKPIPWSLIGDMRSHPEHYVGRPVVMYGLYSPSGQVQLDTEKRNVYGSTSGVKLQRGFLRNLADLKDLAIVDAVGYIGPNNQLKPLETWTGDQGVSVPVLVKGWFVKLWGQQPLILTETIRLLTPRPYDELIRQHTVNRSSLREEERWLYYETLRQMQLTNASSQQQLAASLLQRRLSQLMSEIQDKATADKSLLERDLRREAITEDQFRTRRTRLDRQLGIRLKRHREYLTSPQEFPLFVDIFQNPEEWHGAVVSLSGHVRRVVSYTGDSEMFGSQPLHELWLFTDDSQHNPAVIITPTLPKEFPVEAEVVDRVTVTGCFFKMYVYRADTEHRIAPLILCGRVDWEPSDDQIQSLSAEGALPADSSRVLAARRRADSRISDTAVMLFGFLSIVVMMAIWGRVQRDRRERERLLVLVDSRRDLHHNPAEDVLSGLSGYETSSLPQESKF